MKSARAKRAGLKMAEAVIEFLHLMYNHKTALRVLNAMIVRLDKARKEYVPVKKEKADE